LQTSSLTSKGQVTIPAEVRKRLGLQTGDNVGFILDGDEVRLVRGENRIEAAFGIRKAETSVSVEDMEQIVKHRADA
jgi:antitoxin PrlF